MSFTVIQKEGESARAFVELRKVLIADSKSITKNVGWPHGHDTSTVYWHDRYGFWALAKNVSVSPANRFWCAYGTQNPGKYKGSLSITCEINPPKGNTKSMSAGLFLRDSMGMLYLAHNGRVGGGQAGVGKDAFRSFWTGPFEPVQWSGGRSSTAFVIGKVSGKEFLSRLAKFIFGVERFKENAKTVQTISEMLDQDAQLASHQGDFDPRNIKETQEKVIREINLRRGQPEFRRSLLRAYEFRCAISDCDCPEALEAAHIRPYGGTETNHIQNGILLRSDLHTLFDIGGIGIHPETHRVIVSKSLLKTIYGKMNGKKVRFPTHPSQQPNKNALNERLEGMKS